MGEFKEGETPVETGAPADFSACPSCRIVPAKQQVGAAQPFPAGELRGTCLGARHVDKLVASQRLTRRLVLW